MSGWLNIKYTKDFKSYQKMDLHVKSVAICEDLCKIQTPKLKQNNKKQLKFFFCNL